MKNFKVTSKEDGKTYWISRAHSVVAIVYTMDPRRNEITFLVTRRGQGTEDIENRGKWHCTCGYLDWDETRIEAVQRELWEELGLRVSKDQIIKFCEVDDPRRDARQNIVSRYIVKVDWDDLMDRLNRGIVNTNSYSRGGEQGEIDAIDLIKRNEIYKKEWAFNHGEVLREAFKFIKKKFGPIPYYSEEILEEDND